MPAILIPLLFILCITHFRPALPIQIAVSPTNKKCFMEQVPRGATIYADFLTSSSHDHMDITLIVTNEQGHIIFQKSPISHQKFTIEFAPHYNEYYSQRNPLETYRFCLIPHPRNHIRSSDETRVSFSLKIGGEDARKVDFLKTSHVEETNQKIRELDDIVNSPLFGIDTLRKQEDTLSQQIAATSRHLVIASSLTSIVVVAVGILQFDAVKEVLRKRSVIP